MANIKFSAFTQKVAQADVDFLVGYTGADNVRITPAALGDGIYLPLGGGTMTGDIILNDDVRLRAGTGSDFSFFHNGSNSKINNNTGNIEIENFQDDGDIIFKSDDGSGGTATYFYLDGGGTLTRFNEKLRMQDNVTFQAGSSGDFNIRHNGVDSYLENDTGDLYITNEADDKDIIFSSDNGSGGTASYMSLDGSATRINFFKNTRYSDDVKALFGGGGDLEIYHDGSNSYIQDTGTGDLKLLGTNLRLKNGADTITFLEALSGGAVSIYHNGSKRFETTSGGIEITDEVSIGTSIIHTGDTDTKISFGTDEIVLTTAGTDAVTVDSSQDSTFAGDVTVGALTVGQTAQLVVNHEGGATTVAKFMSRTNRAQVQISDNDTTGYLVSEGGVFSIGRTASASANNINIDASHNVGIGTAAPTDKLNINTGVGTFDFKDYNLTYSTSLGIRAESGYLHLVTESANDFYISTNGFANKRFTVKSDGKIGIGTDAPTAALQVVGLVEYADNAAALLAGLTAGAFYRTGDLLKVVH